MSEHRYKNHRIGEIGPPVRRYRNIRTRRNRIAAEDSSIQLQEIPVSNSVETQQARLSLTYALFPDLANYKGVRKLPPRIIKPAARPGEMHEYIFSRIVAFCSGVGSDIYKETFIHVDKKGKKIMTEVIGKPPWEIDHELPSLEVLTGESRARKDWDDDPTANPEAAMIAGFCGNTRYNPGLHGIHVKNEKELRQKICPNEGDIPLSGRSLQNEVVRKLRNKYLVQIAAQSSLVQATA